MKVEKNEGMIRVAGGRLDDVVEVKRVTNICSLGDVCDVWTLCVVKGKVKVSKTCLTHNEN